MTALAVIFWTSIALIVYTHVGYPIVLRGLAGGGPANHWARPVMRPASA